MYDDIYSKKYVSPRKIGHMRLRQVKLHSLSHGKVDIVWVLVLYLTIYSMPNMFGMSSTMQPGLFTTWQFISLSTLLLAGLVVALFRKTLGTQLLVFYAILLLSALLTLSTTIQDMNLKQPYSSSIPILLALVFYVVCAKATLSPERFNKLSLYFVYFIAFAAVYNLILNAGNILHFTSITDPYEYNFQSFFENRNAFAYLLAIGITLSTYLRAKKILNSLSFVALLLLLVGNLSMTLSRGGVLFAVVSALLYYTLYGRPKKLLLYLITIGVVVLFSLNVLGSSFIEDNIIRSDAGSTHRDAIQQDGLDYFNNHNKWLGSGESIRTYLKEEYGLTSLHNTYLDILITGGILKALAYSILALTIVYYLNNIRKQDSAIGSLLLALFMTYLLYSALETATPLLLSPTSAATTVFIFITPVYLHNYYKENKINRPRKVMNLQ